MNNNSVNVAVREMLYEIRRDLCCHYKLTRDAYMAHVLAWDIASYTATQQIYMRVRFAHGSSRTNAACGLRSYPRLCITNYLKVLRIDWRHAAHALKGPATEAY